MVWSNLYSSRVISEHRAQSCVQIILEYPKLPMLDQGWQEPHSHHLLTMHWELPKPLQGPFLPTPLQPLPEQLLQDQTPWDECWNMLPFQREFSATITSSSCTT